MAAIRLSAEVVLHDADAQLPEGPVWDAGAGRLLWVDIIAGRVHALVPGSGRRKLWQLDRHVGAVAPRAGGGLVVADRHGFSMLEEDPTAPPRSVAELLEPGLRMNDGACDPAGSLWAGSMAYDQRPGAGSVYRLDRDGRVSAVLTRTTVSNGLGWSPDGRTVYFADSPTGRVDAFDWSPDAAPARRRSIVEIPPDAGVPDGLTVDSEGALWVALWGGGCVRRYSPSGELLALVELPVAQVTSCAFGGAALDELYITTGAFELSAAERRDQPLAGALFRCTPGVRGLRAVPYAG